MDKNDSDIPEVKAWAIPEVNSRFTAMRCLELSINGFIKGSEFANIF
jgi:hypothetical protein